MKGRECVKRDVKEVIREYEMAMSVSVFIKKMVATMNVICKTRTQLEIKRILKELIS